MKKNKSIFLLCMFLLDCSNTNVLPDNNTSTSSSSSDSINCSSLKKREEWEQCEKNKIRKIEKYEKDINLPERLNEFVK